MSLEELTGRSVQVMAGKWLIAISGTAFIAGITFLHNDSSGLHAAIEDHSRVLAGISQQMTDLTIAVRDHNITNDTAMNKLLSDDQQHSTAIALAEQAIEQLKRDPHVAERWSPPPSSPPQIQSPLPAIGDAVRHLFSGPQLHHRRH